MRNKILTFLASLILFFSYSLQNPQRANAGTFKCIWTGTACAVPAKSCPGEAVTAGCSVYTDEFGCRGTVLDCVPLIKNGDTTVPASDVDTPLGQIKPPDALAKFGLEPGKGLGGFLNLVLKLLIVGGGIYALINIILAGYAFLSAGDDPKKMEGAWGKIYHSLIGLSFIAGSFVLAAIFGQLIFGDFDAIINPSIPTIEDINAPQPQIP